MWILHHKNLQQYTKLVKKESLCTIESNIYIYIYKLMWRTRPRR